MIRTHAAAVMIAAAVLASRPGAFEGDARPGRQRKIRLWPARQNGRHRRREERDAAAELEASAFIEEITGSHPAVPREDPDGMYRPPEPPRPAAGLARSVPTPAEGIVKPPLTPSDGTPRPASGPPTIVMNMLPRIEDDLGRYLSELPGYTEE